MFDVLEPFFLPEGHHATCLSTSSHLLKHIIYVLKHMFLAKGHRSTCFSRSFHLLVQVKLLLKHINDVL